MKKKNLNRTLALFSLPLLSPETLSSSSKSRIFLYNAHLALLITQLLPTQKNRSENLVTISCLVSERVGYARLFLVSVLF